MGDGIHAYALSTSVEQGGSLPFRLPGAQRGRVRIADTVTGEVRTELDVTGPSWNLDIPDSWPSSLYAATFAPGEAEVYFAVRPRWPGRRNAMLVPVPFLTWQAYNMAEVPGEGLYPTEGPDRATRVTFDRPGGGPAGNWEDNFYRWLARRGYRVDYCSNLDLHGRPEILDDYRLLVCAGHDEYWTKEMRDAVETFIAGGGNVAFFCGNTCWWQVRLEDDERTMVCYRDALSDPITPVEPRRATVEWSNAPVHRPENTMTGVSFRRGAGCWENMRATESEAYSVRFAGHWVYDGTGLRDGDTFGTGAIGYETDAADFVERDGVPLVTGVDGTSPDFVILATADLRHWRRYGQGGYATMGILRTGGGTVFNAATVQWGDTVDDPVVERITRNVLDRLSGRTGGWEPMGTGAELISVAACEQMLFGVAGDGSLAVRPCRTQNLRWRPLEPVPGLVALAAPREGRPGCPVLLYGLYSDGRIRGRDPVAEAANWTDLYAAPPGTVGIAPVNETMYAVDATGELHRRPLAAGGAEPWAYAGSGPVLIALTTMSGRLIGVTDDGTLLSRVPESGAWTRLDSRPGLITVAAWAGRLIGATGDGTLLWRDAFAATDPGPPDEEGGESCADMNSSDTDAYA